MALGWAPVCVGGAKKESPATLYLPISERDCCGPFGWHEGQDSCFFLSFGRFGSRDDFVFVYLAFGGIGVSTALSGWG